MKSNSWKAMFNQSYGIKFVAAALGLVLLSVFTVCAVPAMAGGQGGETTVAAAEASSGSDSTADSKSGGEWECQAVSYEDGSQGVDIFSRAEDESFAQTLSANPPSEPDVIVSHAVSGTVSHTVSYDWQETSSDDETRSTLGWPGPECNRSNACAISNHHATTRLPRGLIWMSDEQIRHEIDHIGLERFYSVSDGGQDLPFDFDMFYKIIGIIRSCDWLDGKDHDASALGGNKITVRGQCEVYTYLCFARDEQGRGIVWSAYDNKMAYLSEEDYTDISNMLARAK